MNDADILWRELEFERRQRHFMRDPWFFGWHRLKMYALPPSERNYLYAPVSNSWDQELNRSLALPTLVMFSYLADHLRMSGLKVFEDLGRKAKFKIVLTALGTFLRTVRHGVVNRLVSDEMTYVCGDDSVLIRVSHGLVRKWFDMGIFRMFRRLHCNSILALLVIALLAEGDRDVTGVEWFSFGCERSKFIFIPLVLGVTRKRADGTKVT